MRFHGRGGQGVVTASELLSLAAFAEGRHAQAFPFFGSERMGAPVMAFCRIDDRPIRLREPVARPDAVVVQDPTLLHQIAVFAGLATGGLALINSSRDATELGLDVSARVVTLPATQIAREHVGRPIPNAALLGGFAALTGLVSRDGVRGAIAQKFEGSVAARNEAAAAAAYDLCAEPTRA